MAAAPDPDPYAIAEEDRMRIAAPIVGWIAALTALSADGVSAPVAAAASPPPFQGPILAQDRVLGRAIDTLQVTSPAFGAGQPIPLVHSAYGKSLSIPLSWSAGPRATRSYVIVMEDPDSHLPQPTLHWLAYNIPPGVTALPKGVKDREAFSGPRAFMQGRNSKGGIGYVGPHPSPADPPHHYHVQVFALSRTLDVGPGATLDQVVAAMNDRVLAEGELVGTFTPTATKPVATETPAAPSPAPAPLRP